MEFEITVDDLDRKFKIKPAQSILDALLSHGVAFAYSCQSGNCGACKCELVCGEVDALAFSEQALSRHERTQGVILACRSRPRSDLTIRRLPGSHS